MFKKLRLKKRLTILKLDDIFLEYNIQSELAFGPPDRVMLVKRYGYSQTTQCGVQNICRKHHLYPFKASVLPQNYD